MKNNREKVYVTRQISVCDKDVIAKLEELKEQKVNISRYLCSLVKQDIENSKNQEEK